MKYCPTCNTRYDEEILRFCMKDGTPLLEEEEPNFITMPSESFENIDEDDAGEATVIRRNVPVPPPVVDDEESFRPDTAQRIVVPTTQAQAARPRVIPPSQQPPKANTFKVVMLTMLGTLGVLALGAAGFWFLQNDRAENTNVNVNANFADVNTNLNTNLGLNSNFNFNVNANFNTNSSSNTNLNSNIRTPTPTPRPTPTASPLPTPTRMPDDDEDSPTPARSPTPIRTPLPTPSPIIIRPGQTPPSNRMVNSGVLNGRASRLPAPSYPVFARQAGASGQVAVQVSVDQRGNVVSARAISGHPLLRQAAESAARQSKINPVKVGNQNVGLTGVLLYNFRSN